MNNEIKRRRLYQNP